jgi:hypothetical protein
MENNSIRTVQNLVLGFTEQLMGIEELERGKPP